MSDFPDGFLWGSATSAHQVEGGNTNSDWWEWEHTPGSAAVESSGDGIDHWHRYDEDFALLAALGQNAHRFSLEWSRIEPAEGEFSRAALDHYARVLESLAHHGLTAFATLYHFTLPRWFAARGGWLADDALDVLGRYVEKIAQRVGDLIPYACTVNEPQIVALQGYWRGHFPPGRQNIEEAQHVNSILAQAHRTATAALRSGHGRPKIGTCLQLPCIEPLRSDCADDIATADMIRTGMVDSTSTICAAEATSVISSGCSTTPGSRSTRLCPGSSPRPPPRRKPHKWVGRCIRTGSVGCFAASRRRDCRSS
jgi:beta-glucosidase